MKKKVLAFSILAIILIIGIFVYYNTRFPDSIKFGQILGSQTITKIVVTDGNTGKVRQTDNTTKINQLIQKLADEKLHRSNNIWQRSGFSYAVDFYIKNKPGYYTYLHDLRFYQSNDFTGSMPIGNCYCDNKDTVKKIISDFYADLKP